VPATVNRGVPIVQDDPKHPVSIGIRQFADTLVAGPPVGGEAAGRGRAKRRKV